MFRGSGGQQLRISDWKTKSCIDWLRWGQAITFQNETITPNWDCSYWDSWFTATFGADIFTFEPPLDQRKLEAQSRISKNLAWQKKVVQTRMKKVGDKVKPCTQMRFCCFVKNLLWSFQTNMFHSKKESFSLLPWPISKRGRHRHFEIMVLDYES